jgi:hypothetical protein
MSLGGCSRASRERSDLESDTFSCELSGAEGDATSICYGWAYDAAGAVRATTGLRYEKRAIAKRTRLHSETSQLRPEHGQKYSDGRAALQEERRYCEWRCNTAEPLSLRFGP